MDIIYFFTNVQSYICNYKENLAKYGTFWSKIWNSSHDIVYPDFSINFFKWNRKVSFCFDICCHISFPFHFHQLVCTVQVTSYACPPCCSETIYWNEIGVRKSFFLIQLSNGVEIYDDITYCVFIWFALYNFSNKTLFLTVVEVIVVCQSIMTSIPKLLKYFRFYHVAYTYMDGLFYHYT